MAKILVVDDEPSVLQLLTIFLRSDGHQIVTAGSGAEALRTFRELSFDLVITDRAMPEMNGDVLAASIKKIRGDVPVILLTGLAGIMRDVGDQPDAIDLVLGKPLTHEALRNALAKVVKTKQPVENDAFRPLKQWSSRLVLL